MRTLWWLSWVGLAGLAACSNAVPAGNSVDVAAAASRAESDIANYAAAPKEAPATATIPSAAPPAPVPDATRPTVIATATPLARDATPAAVARRYFDAIQARRYGDAWRLWQGQGHASGVSEAAFAKSFAPYAIYAATLGTPGDEDAGAGQRYVTVPVTVTGRLRTGAPFRLEGQVVLHRIAEGIVSDDPEAHAWRLRKSEIHPHLSDDATGSS